MSSVAFYRGTTLIGTDTTAPYSVSWPNVAAGTYSVTAKAIDNRGAVTTSAALTVTVKTNALPSVTISAPATNSSYVAPATINMTAVASDSDGTIAKVNYVSITSPLDNAHYLAPASFILTAAASVPSGSVSKVEFISGGNVIGTVTAPPYSVSLNNIVPGNYSVTAKATGSLGGITTSAPISMVVAANAAPVVSLQANPATADAPADITLTAIATDSDGTIAKVEFFNGATLLATVTQAPYTYTWTAVLAGTYPLTAIATDNLNLATTSAVQSLTITPPSAPGVAQVYYIYSDQINTAREITNAAGVKIWQADPEPFGANVPNENPAGQGSFTYNPRFPGQYFDKETGLHCNYFRDYDPQAGRYVQSDLIGLSGGINTYGYVGGNPLSITDPSGLAPKVVVCINGVCPLTLPPGLVDPFEQPLPAPPLHSRLSRQSMC